MTEAQSLQGSLLVRSAPRQSHLESTRLWTSRLLSRDERLALEDAASPPKSIGAGVDLVREGERADNLFIVTEGWVCRHSSTRRGGRQLTGLLVPGDVGNVEALMFDRLDQGVRTLTPTKVVMLPRDRVMSLAAEHVGILQAFTWAALVDNAILGRWALSLGRRSSKERLAHLLCELSMRLGSEAGGASSFAFPLTQEQLADALGLTPVHVNRTMQQLRSEGLIVTAHRTMTLPDVSRLAQICGFDPRYLHIDAAS